MSCGKLPIQVYALFLEHFLEYFFNQTETASVSGEIFCSFTAN